MPGNSQKNGPDLRRQVYFQDGSDACGAIADPQTRNTSMMAERGLVVEHQMLRSGSATNQGLQWLRSLILRGFFTCVENVRKPKPLGRFTVQNKRQSRMGLLSSRQTSVSMHFKLLSIAPLFVFYLYGMCSRPPRLTVRAGYWASGFTGRTTTS
jgi:hypothetical protein